MPTTYTDVDRLLLERWNDTRGLLDAYEELQDRIHDVIDEVGARLSEWAQAQGYNLDTEAKTPAFSIYRSTWLSRRRDTPLVYLELANFAPIGYRRVKENHPDLWLYTENLQTLRMKEPERVQFSRDLRAQLGDAAAEWKHDDSSDADYPLGKQLSEVSDADRVRLVSDTDVLFDFSTKALTSAFVLSDTIDKALTAAKSRE
jgi:hypothetical protein